MDKKSVLRFKKNMMITWAVVAGVCGLVIILSVVTLIRGDEGLFSPVTGIFVPLLVMVAGIMQVKTYFKENTLSYVLATVDHKAEIMNLFNKAKDAMAAQGIDQWDEVYPNINDIAKDIRDEHMTAVILNGKVIAAYTLNQHQDPSYNFGNFTDVEDKFLVLHRFCLHPDVWQSGYAPQILAYLENKAKKEGTLAIRLDAFTKNPRALNLYEKNGYVYVGDAFYRKGKFSLMEKLL